MASREGQAQLDETLAGLGETISNVKNNLRAEFLPAISEVISAFTGMVNGVDGADEAFAGAITGLVRPVRHTALLLPWMTSTLAIRWRKQGTPLTLSIPGCAVAGCSQ